MGRLARKRKIKTTDIYNEKGKKSMAPDEQTKKKAKKRKHKPMVPIEMMPLEMQDPYLMAQAMKVMERAEVSLHII
jgi:hypothetical protein